MYFFKEMLAYLRTGFVNRWTFIAAVILLSLLDPITFVGIVWYFLLRQLLPIEPNLLILISHVYLSAAILMGILSILGRLKAVRAVSLFYISVGLFFLLTGMFAADGKEFAAWPWIILWMTTLVVTLRQFGTEFRIDKKETPEL
jgi:hypothetical protein